MPFLLDLVHCSVKKLCRNVKLHLPIFFCSVFTLVNLPQPLPFPDGGQGHRAPAFPSRSAGCRPTPPPARPRRAARGARQGGPGRGREQGGPGAPRRPTPTSRQGRRGGGTRARAPERGAPSREHLRGVPGRSPLPLDAKTPGPWAAPSRDGRAPAPRSLEQGGGAATPVLGAAPSRELHFQISAAS